MNKKDLQEEVENLRVMIFWSTLITLVSLSLLLLQAPKCEYLPFGYKWILCMSPLMIILSLLSFFVYSGLMDRIR